MFRFQLLLKLLYLRLDHEATVRLIRVRAVIVLVIVLGFVKRLEGRNFGDDVAAKMFLRFRLLFLGSKLLGFAVIENNRPVLCP